MKDETRQTLELLVEKANLLKSVKFDEHVRTVGLGFKGKRTGEDEWEIEFGLPDEEKRNSFILTFRFFYQEEETISFSKLSRFLNDPELSDEWKSGVSKARKAYFRYLKSYSDYSVELFDGHPTRREMLDAVLYGGVAHANPEKIQRLRLWTRDGIRANVLLQEFTAMLVQILAFISYIGELSEHELALKPA
jgi:hypothetical protein